MPPSPLSLSLVERILESVGRLTIAVLGDLFLDRYLDIDSALTEPSLETGLDAYQVVGIRANPGAAGTVVNNLAALGVGRVLPIAVIGDDGEGYELRQALERMNVYSSGVLTRADRRTPTYTKPMLHEAGQPPRELNRLDIHNRTPLPEEAEVGLLAFLEKSWPTLDGVVVLDQVSQPECGVITSRVRQRIAELTRQSPRPILADSRERIGLFREVGIKPNQRECQHATGVSHLFEAVKRLSNQTHGPVFCTRAEHGILLAQPGRDDLIEVPAFPVAGPIDPVGAGDSTSAGIICALASGLAPAEAAAFGNLVASITVQQIGTTGTASPEQVRRRWREVHQG
jgi:rfaE bifunctional protein kinase chain/domain